MPPPVPRDAYAVALGNIRQLLATVKDTPDPKEVTLKAFQAIEATTDIAQKFLLSIAALEDKVETWELAAPRSHGQKSLSESKCVSNLKSLGSDKAEFKLWNDKLINALACRNPLALQCPLCLRCAPPRSTESRSTTVAAHSMIQGARL